MLLPEGEGHHRGSVGGRVRGCGGGGGDDDDDVDDYDDATRIPTTNAPPPPPPLQFRSAGHAAAARAVPAPPARNAGDACDRHSHIISILLLLLSFSSPPSPLTTSWKYPNSSRVRAYMYDYSSNSLYITWQNGKPPWVYDDVYPALFEAFDAAPSKGKYINSTLNYTSHYPASSSEMDVFTGV